jgi:hypothetical protein
MPKPPRTPTVAEIAAQVAALTRRLDALTAPPPGEGALAPLPALGDVAMAEALGGRRGAPYEEGARRGAVAYAGGATIAGREYLWQVERPLPALLDLDGAGPAAVLAALAHPHRVRLLLALLAAPRGAAELQAIIGSSSPGPLYHHLKDLLALGVVVQADKAYQVPARHVVPLLTVIAITLDLGARRAAAASDAAPPPAPPTAPPAARRPAPRRGRPR